MQRICVVSQCADSAHNIASIEMLAGRLSALTGASLLPTRQDFDESSDAFLVPTFAMVRADGHPEMSVETFFGGIVDHGFMATKLVTHPHLHDNDKLPEGWAEGFAARLKDCVLEGYSVFSHDHAKEAAELLIKKHKIRFKNPYSSGGNDQTVVHSRQALETFLETVSAAEMAKGLVVEEDVENSTTYSVGQVRLLDQTGSYLGRQYTVDGPDGFPVYAGSRLWVVRGGWDALLLNLQSPISRSIVAKARQYDEAATQHLGLIASRKNYDVLVGPITETGFRCGVLEQSWRIGGASPAEVLAMEKFAQNRNISAVQAVIREDHGHPRKINADDFVVYSGNDDLGLPLQKIARVEKIHYDP